MLTSIYLNVFTSWRANRRQGLVGQNSFTFAIFHSLTRTFPPCHGPVNDRIPIDHTPGFIPVRNITEMRNNSVWTDK